MNLNYKALPTLVIVFSLMSIGISETGLTQSWQDPALQQPVRQYFSGDRYPLTSASNAITPARPKTQPATLPKAEPKRFERPQTTQDLGNRPIAKPKTNATDRSLTSKPAVDKKTASPKKKSVKKTDKSKAKSKSKSKPHHPVKTWDLYRDRSHYPIDPRKPCSVCKREVGSCDCQCGCQFSHRGIGNKGMPWQDTEPGGRTCGKKNCCNKRPEYSVYWPKPLSARRENRNGCCQGCGHATCRCRKVNDLFDHLVNFSLIDYQRKDNAYCGPGADPYGCLGESRAEVASVGVGYSLENATR